MKIGDRVGAVQNSDGDKIYIYGYGTYEGDHVPPENVGGFNLGIPNPKINLDNGNTVYGCECWWGPEEKIKDMAGDLEVVIVEPDRK